MKQKFLVKAQAQTLTQIVVAESVERAIELAKENPNNWMNQNPIWSYDALEIP